MKVTIVETETETGIIYYKVYVNEEVFSIYDSIAVAMDVIRLIKETHRNKKPDLIVYSEEF